MALWSELEGVDGFELEGLAPGFCALSPVDPLLVEQAIENAADIKAIQISLFIICMSLLCKVALNRRCDEERICGVCRSQKVRRIDIVLTAQLVGHLRHGSVPRRLAASHLVTWLKAALLLPTELLSARSDPQRARRR